jgi:hypothetical protein
MGYPLKTIVVVNVVTPFFSIFKLLATLSTGVELVAFWVFKFLTTVATGSCPSTFSGVACYLVMAMWTVEWMAHHAPFGA